MQMFAVTLICVWAGAADGPYKFCYEDHQNVDTNAAMMRSSNIPDDVKKAVADALPQDKACERFLIGSNQLSQKFGLLKDDPAKDTHVRKVKEYCQYEHDGPSYRIDLRTRQITVIE